MSKLFDEVEWEDDLPAIGTNFRFTKKSDTKKQKNILDESENHKEVVTDEQQSSGKKPTGWSILLKPPKSNVAIGRKAEAAAEGLTKSEKRKAKKRKADDQDVNGTTNQTADETGSDRKKSKQTGTAASNGTESPNGETSPAQPQLNGSSTGAKPTGGIKKGEKASKKELQSLSLKDKLVESLKGSRFRFINEQLYKMPGEGAKKLFEQDPESFDAYHAGYRQQVEQWPMNPLDRMIKSIRKMPKDTIIADFGCGEAKLAASVSQKVYSLDLIANNNGVIACDMANTPLESSFVNVVVFCLSLMGTNLSDFLLEANRVLKVGGILKIAEVASRFDNVNEFVSTVKKCGFQLQTKDLKHKLFYFFIFKKDRTVIKGSTKIKPYSLKPCLYKKR